MTTPRIIYLLILTVTSTQLLAADAVETEYDTADAADLAALFERDAPMAISNRQATQAQKLAQQIQNGGDTPSLQDSATIPTENLKYGTEISSLPFTISSPGSYTLTQSLANTTNGSDGITITSSHVTLDMGGFGISADTTSGDDGIVTVGDLFGIQIRNGHISGWDGDGIDARSCDSCLFHNLTVSDNTLNGISTGFASIISEVTALNNSQDGIVADDGSVIIYSAAFENTLEGIDASLASTVAYSTSQENGETGIRVASGSTVLACTSQENGQHGFHISPGSTIQKSTAYNNDWNGYTIFFATFLRDNTAELNGFSGTIASQNNGYRVSANSYLVNNHARSNDGAGIQVFSGDVTVENNVAIDNNRAGIESTSSGGLYIRNRAANNGPSGAPVNYSLGTNNAYGPIINVNGVGDISAIAGADHALANLEY